MTSPLERFLSEPTAFRAEQRNIVDENFLAKNLFKEST
jgi:hypothetical protein